MPRMIIIISVILLSLLTFACGDGIVEFDEPQEVGVHFQFDFFSDVVSLTLDGVEEYRDTVTTNTILGRASITSLRFTKWRQVVRVTVNDSSSAELPVYPGAAKTVVVRYDRETKAVTLGITTQDLKYY